jgi:hypothetical protein
MRAPAAWSIGPIERIRDGAYRLGPIGLPGYDRPDIIIPLLAGRNGV